MVQCLYELLYMIPLCMITVLFYSPYVKGQDHQIWIILVSLISLGMFLLILHWKNRLRYLVPIYAFSAVAVLILLQPSENRIDFILGNSWVLWAFLTGAGSFLAGFLVAENRRARRIFCLGVLIFMGADLFLQRTDSEAISALAFFLILLCGADEIQHGWKKKGYPEGKKHLVFIAPFLVLTGVLVFFIPAPEKPVDWSFVMSAAERTASFVKEKTVWLHNKEDYNAEVGFSGEGYFYGSLLSKEKEVMQLKADIDGENTVYLTGKVMDTFDGREWKENYSEENNDRMMDTIELYAAVLNYDEAHRTDYIRRTGIELTYLDLYTKYCFAPMKVLPLSRSFSGIKWDQKGGDLIASNQLGYKKSYRVTYYRQNRGSTEFEKLAETSTFMDKETWESGIEKCDTELTVSYDDYLNYRKKVYETYLPDTTLSEDAKKYFAGITRDAKSDYEKCARISEALSSMDYTLSPGELPEYVDSEDEFMDYFLFHKQKGYCLHFATALVLAARDQGLPARLVQGYRVSALPGKTVSVMSDSAHAWAEIYFDGMGWILFDPTPNAPEYVCWSDDEYRAQTSFLPEEIKSPKMQDQKTVEPQGDDADTTVFYWQIIWIPTVFLILYLILWYIRVRFRYRKLSGEAGFIYASKKNIRILEYLGYSLKAGETLEEYGSRICKELKKECVAFLEPYELYCYRDQAPRDRDITLVKENTGILLKQLKKQKGKRYFLYYFRLEQMALRMT